MIAHSPIWQEMLAERECQTRQKDIIKILKARFQAIPEELTSRISLVQNLEKLDILVEAAAICQDISSFQDSLTSDS